METGYINVSSPELTALDVVFFFDEVGGFNRITTVLEELSESMDAQNSLFAAELGMKLSHFSELLHGKRHVSAATAIKLEKLLEIPAEYWMRVQVYYDLFVERQREREKSP